MHNFRIFRVLLIQMERNLSDEIDRLTINNWLWRILAKLRLLPARNKMGYGSFVKSSYYRVVKKEKIPDNIYLKLNLENKNEKTVECDNARDTV